MCPVLCGCVQRLIQTYIVTGHVPLYVDTSQKAGQYFVLEMHNEAGLFFYPYHFVQACGDTEAIHPA